MEILYQDKNCIVCVKPAGLASEGEGESLLTRLASERGGAFYPVHRLDKPVGGVMVCAKNARAAAKLSAAIQSGAFGKEYLAVLRGVPAEPAGTLTDLLYHDPRVNKTFVVKTPRKGVREASLEYETVGSADGLTLVRVRLLTGRTHQIRAQFASRGTPLTGDGRYGGGSGPMGLWAWRLTFPDPAGGRELTFRRRPPDGEPWCSFDLP